MKKQWELIPGLADELLDIRRTSGSLIDDIIAEMVALESTLTSSINTKVSKSGDTMTGTLVLNSTADIATNPKILSFHHLGTERGYLRNILDSVSSSVFPELLIRRLLLGGNDGIYSPVGISGGGQSKIYFTNNGETISFMGQSFNHWFVINGASGAINFGGAIGFTTSGGATGSADAIIVRDAADTIGFRRSTNPYRINVYNTYSDSSNFERGYFRWTSNVFEISMDNAGTGSNRNILVRGADGAKTWEAGGTLTLRGGVGQDSFYSASAGTIRACQ